MTVTWHGIPSVSEDGDNDASGQLPHGAQRVGSAALVRESMPFGQLSSPASKSSRYAFCWDSSISAESAFSHLQHEKRSRVCVMPGPGWMAPNIAVRGVCGEPLSMTARARGTSCH